MVWPASSFTSSNWWLPFFQRLDMLLNITIFESNSFLIDSQCPAFEPFRCPEERKCISIQVKGHPYPPHNQHNCNKNIATNAIIHVLLSLISIISVSLWWRWRLYGWLRWGPEVVHCRSKPFLIWTLWFCWFWLIFLPPPLSFFPGVSVNLS